MYTIAIDGQIERGQEFTSYEQARNYARRVIRALFKPEARIYKDHSIAERLYYNPALTSYRNRIQILRVI